MKRILILACMCVSVTAQIRVQQKLALVIGNGAYPGNALKNPPNDAAAMARTLRALGFDDVAEKRDLNRRQMRQEIDKFIAKINKGDMAWVYYAGHGVQANERNYLIPVDFVGEESDLDYDAYPADQLRDKLEKSGARLRISDSRCSPQQSISRQQARWHARSGAHGLVSGGDLHCLRHR